jgi:hypothetical protein
MAKPRVTLERSVKRRVTAYLLELRRVGVPIFCRMSVPQGYGRSGLDYEGCLAGHYFSIETKSPDPEAELTPRQRAIAKDIVAAGGRVFIISDEEGLQAFKRWVDHILSSQMTNSSHLLLPAGQNLECHG